MMIYGNMTVENRQMPDFPAENVEKPQRGPLADRPLPQEVEVAAVIGLEHVVHVEASISAARSSRGRRSGAALGENRLVKEKIEPEILHDPPDVNPGPSHGV